MNARPNSFITAVVATATVVALLAGPVFAGGPVLPDEPELIFDFGTAPGPWARNATDALFTPLANNGAAPIALDTGDFDGDTTTDLLLAFDGTATNSGIYERNSTGGFNKIGNGIANRIGVGNFDSLGDDDVAVTFQEGQPLSPPGTWIRTDLGYRLVTNFTATRIAVGDVNNAGPDELIVTFEEVGLPAITGTWIIFDPNGIPTFKKIRNEAAQPLVVCGNVNDAGGDDILVTYPTEGVSYAYVDDTAHTRILGANTVSVYGCADLDGVSGDEIVATIPPQGTFYRNLNGVGWTQIANEQAAVIVGGNFDNMPDENAENDLGLTFSDGGNSTGTWSLRNLTKPLVKENNTTAVDLELAEITGD